jgi:hypothetical protein
MAGPTKDPFAAFADAPAKGADPFAAFADAAPAKPKPRTFEEKIADPATRRQIVQEGGRRYAQETLMSARKKKNPLDRFLSGVQQSFGAQFVGAGTGAFGVGDAVIAKKFKKENPWMTDEDATEAMKAYRDEVFSKKPLSAGVGAVAGAVGSGGAVAKGVGATGNVVARAAPAAAPVVRAVTGATTLTKGQPVANVAKLASTGLAATAATTGIAEGRLPTATEAAVGALSGPALAGLAKLSGMGSNWISARFDIDGAAIRELGKKIGLNIDERAAARQAQTGEAPLLGEILTPAEQNELSRFIVKAPEAQNIMDAGVEAAEDRFAAGVRSDVAGMAPPGVAPRGANVTTRELSDNMDAAMGQLRPEIVRITPQMIEALRDNKALAGISRAEMRALEGGQVPIDVLENIRTRLSNPSANNIVGTRLIEEIITQQYPAYGQAMRAFAADSARAAAAEAGAGGVLSDMTTENFLAAPKFTRDASVDPSVVRGFVEGSLDKLQGAAQANPQAVANKFLRGGVSEKIGRLVGQARADRAVTSMEGRAQGLESVRGVSGRRAVSQSQISEAQTADAANAALMAVMPFGGAAKAAVARRATMNIALPNAVRERVAEMLLDPDRAVDAVGLLVANGATQQEILNMYQVIAANAGVQAADLGNEDAP